MVSLTLRTYLTIAPFAFFVRGAIDTFYLIAVPAYEVHFLHRDHLPASVAWVVRSVILRFGRRIGAAAAAAATAAAAAAAATAIVISDSSIAAPQTTHKA